MLKLNNSDCQPLARRLATLVQSGQDAKGSLPARWQENESLYDNEQPEEKDEDSKIVRVPTRFLQPRVDMLTAMVCGVVSKQEPYMIAKDLQSGERSDRLEKALHFFWQRAPAAFENKVRNASTVAANTNKAIWKLSYRPFEPSEGEMRAVRKMGIVMEVIHPDYFVCTPATKDGIDEARLVGNCFFKRRRYIKDKQASKEYLDYMGGELTQSTLEEADTTGALNRSLSQPSITGQEKDDDLVKIWDLVVRLDLDGQTVSGDEKSPKRKSGEQLYRILLAEDSPCILSIEEYPYSRPMYFESFYIADEKAYWSGRSVGFNLQGPDKTYNMMFSAMYNGVMNEALPLVVGDLPEKFTEYGFGDIITDAEDMSNPPWAAPSRFSGANALIFGIQETSRVGDQTARISQASMGSVTNKDTTATEQNIVQGGVSAGQEEYIANFSNCFPEMAEATMELLKLHWDDWFPILGLRPALDPMTGLPPMQPMMGPIGQPVADPTGQPVMVPVINPKTGLPPMLGMVDLPKEDMDAYVVWEPTGKTPGNTPQAKVQAAQGLLETALVAPQTGLDPYEVTRVLVASVGLNADGVQKTKQQMMMEMQQAAAQQAAQGAQDGAPKHGNGQSPPPGVA